MPTIQVSDATFERLQRHAKALVDTAEMVINRAVDALEQSETTVTPASGHNSHSERPVDPRKLPNMTHAKVLDAAIDGAKFAKPKWNALADEMVRRAVRRVGFEKLQQICPANIVKGRKVDDGYTYLPDVDLSIQGQDANGACRTVVTAAQGLGLSLEISFMWRQKEGAAHPGEMGRIRVIGRTLGR